VASPVPTPYSLEFYDDPVTGRQPVLEWMRGIDPYLRRAIGVALREVLQRRGVEVCQGEWGEALGDGLFEFRVRRNAEETLEMYGRQAKRAEPDERLTLRVFFHPHGNKLLLLLNGYDKADDPSGRRQDEEIKVARKRLQEYRSRRTA
jgi:hypothetical protein